MLDFVSVFHISVHLNRSLSLRLSPLLTSHCNSTCHTSTTTALTKVEGTRKVLDTKIGQNSSDYEFHKKVCFRGVHLEVKHSSFLLPVKI